MRILTLLLLALIAAIQYPLWLGKGSWLRVWDLESQIKSQHATNDRLAARNAGLDAEVADLKNGFDAIEERARTELGMIKQDEVFIQVLSGNPGAATPAGPQPARPPAR